MIGLANMASLAIGDTIRLTSWNVSNYSAGRVTEFQTAIFESFEGRSMSPDILVGQEFLSAASVVNFLNMLNTAPASTNDWAAAIFVDGPDTDSALFYRTGSVQMATDLSPNGVTVVATGGNAPNHPRNIMRYDVVIKPQTPQEFHMSIYSTHMKTGSSGSDQSRRLLEAQRIRDNAEVLPKGWHFMLCGDFNIQSSQEAAYQELVGSQTNKLGRFVDPISTLGNWNNNSSFRFVHTQDQSGAGGMDDRYDQILVSTGLVDEIGVEYVGEPLLPYSTTTWNDSNHSYRSWGNDGTSFNTSLTVANNQMVGPTIAQALINSAPGGGHLPIFLDIETPEFANLPTNSTWGLIVLMLLLSTFATLLIRRQSANAACGTAAANARDGYISWAPCI